MRFLIASGVIFGLGTIITGFILGNTSPTARAVWDQISHKTGLGPQNNERGCFAYQHLNTKRLGQRDPSERLAYLDNKQVSVLQEDIVAQSPKEGNVLSAHLTPQGEEKWIEINLSEQKLRAWEGNRQVMEHQISSGKASTPTPEGEFRIWVKLRYTKMEGGSRVRGDYYYLPNVPWVMYFHKGYGIHGAYWHMRFGTPVSHGCINLRIADAGNLFTWAAPALPAGKSVSYPTPENPGTRVVVHR